MSERIHALTHWLESELGWKNPQFTAASADASFRRYFRIYKDNSSYIIMDAPPEKEDCRPFVQVTELMSGLGLHVPKIIEKSLENGFLLLSDLGDDLYLNDLDEQNADQLYGDAMAALVLLQVCEPHTAGLPAYDQSLLQREMSLFTDWLLATHLQWSLDEEVSKGLQDIFQLLVQNALQQPQVCVHRDYHSRNLMVCADHNPGILDYQDAVIGPVTYDLVSLLKDCYVSWPRARVQDWALGYRELAIQSGILDKTHVDEAQFMRWFDWMGVQRHLKASGIFARLNHRDGKSDYLKDIPRTLGYISEVCGTYPQLDPLGEIVETVLGKL